MFGGGCTHVVLLSISPPLGSMSMPGRHNRTFISWLKVIPKTTSVRSVLSALLRLIRYCHVVIGRPGNQRACRERGLALSSQADEPARLTASLTLAVSILQAPLHSEECRLGTEVHPLHERSHAATFKNQVLQNSCSPLTPSSGSELSAVYYPRRQSAQCQDSPLTPL
jgi:hypothetical protein